MKMGSFLKRKSQKNENIFIFDFDGTLFRYDLLIFYLTFHFFAYNDKVFLVRSFISAYNQGLSSIREKIFLNFSSKYELTTCFKNFSRVFFVRYFLRKKLFLFFEKINKDNSTIFVVTANYQELVKAFLEENDIFERINLKVVGTELPKKNEFFHKKILKGKLKAKKISQIFIEKKIEISDFDIYNFFDSYEDRYLCKLATHNILISTFNQKKIKYFKKNFNVITYKDFMKKV